jgi:hypothetical protein
MNSPDSVEFIRSLGGDALMMGRSHVSVQIARNRYGRPSIIANNLKLPLAVGVAHAVISDGAMHHANEPAATVTKDCRVSFLCPKENAEQSHLHSGSKAQAHGYALRNRDIR